MQTFSNPMGVNGTSLFAATSEKNAGMSDLLQFLLVLAVIIIAAKLAGLISTKLGQPAVLGELLAGVLLGPTLLNIFGLPFINSPSIGVEFKHLAELGVILLMFMAGLETDLNSLSRVGKVAVYAGLLGVLSPIALGSLGAWPFGFNLEQALFIGIVLSATSVSISAQTLLELGVIKRKEGIALLGAAVIDDVIVILVLSIFGAVVTSGGGGPFDILLVLGRMLLYFGVAGLFGWKILPWLLNRAAKLPVSQGLTAITLVIILALAWSAEYLGGIALIVGAFLTGVMVGRTRHRHDLEKSFHTLTYGFFVPIFFASIGLAANLATLSLNDLLFAATIVVIAIISKVVGCGLGARLGGFNNGESLRMGLGMISRGEVGLIVASVGLNEGLIGENIYGTMVLMVLLTTLITPLVLKTAYRNINTGNGRDEKSPLEKEDGKQHPALEA
ncbi:MAG TPA: cation:proton antiporter [Chloroflexia bacterium]|nr:cation:proton antiporter [Chloroflexia bacterium]